MQTLTKKVRQLEEDFEQTETRLHAANEKFSEASKAADESERLSSTYSVRLTFTFCIFIPIPPFLFFLQLVSQKSSRCVWRIVDLLLWLYMK